MLVSTTHAAALAHHLHAIDNGLGTSQAAIGSFLEIPPSMTPISTLPLPPVITAIFVPALLSIVALHYSAPALQLQSTTMQPPYMSHVSIYVTFKSTNQGHGECKAEE